ncbi:hypothetical protein [Capnocytophaga sp. oral taxon 380]|uniref:hypothetical protein n=1 Tax=Capnocytophaga sp. oral taxon 380 TaxID=712217 RepID=UPI0002A38F91|nr:hypothetical protein [Capnocytophaga sp. oral taxon 380]EKY08260.1 hypothetical protein HMPREF9078_00940 [Capnocytophaga sp. oral taxon 380 str. F0488]
MVKKIFLLTFMAIGMTACSKSDDTPMNSGDNNKLLGTWVGTAEVIAEKPAQQSKVSELFKQSYGALLGSPESNYQTYTVRVVFNEKRLNITNKEGQYSFQDIAYSTLGDKIVNDEKKQPLATYSIENNRLLAENTDFFYLITDTNLDNLENEKAEAYLKEFSQLDTTASGYAEKLIELQLKYGLAYKYKYKYNLVRQ